MSFRNLFLEAQQYFPNLQIKYKDRSWLLRWFSQPATTVGDTVYFTSEKFIKCHPISACVILLHELVHAYDQKRIGKIPFIVSYLLPQILFTICLLLMVILSWKILLPIMIFCFLPFPAVFKMHWEKRAYLSSLYILQVLGKRMNFDPHLQAQEDTFLKYFHTSYLYPFHDIDEEFDAARELAINGKRPFEDPLFEMLEDLVSKM
jgi:hypothetical protein